MPVFLATPSATLTESCVSLPWMISTWPLILSVIVGLWSAEWVAWTASF